MKTRSLEFDGSTMKSILGRDGDAIIQLRPASILESNFDPKNPSTPSGQPAEFEQANRSTQSADLIIRRAGQVGSVPDVPTRLTAGSVSTDRANFERVLPLPLMLMGSVSAQFAFENGDSVMIAGEDLEVVLLD